MFGEGIVSDRTCKRWFKKFKTGDFDLSDMPHSGRPSLIDNDVVKIMLEQAGKPSPSISKPNLTLNKRMLCMWWDIRGPIHYELLKPSKKLNLEKYCQQLDDLKTAVQEKRPKMFNRKDIILHYDNGRPHAALGTH